MRAYFPANYQVKRRKILFSSKSQFDPTKEHTQPLGAACFKPSAAHSERSENGKKLRKPPISDTKATHWQEQIILIKLDDSA